MPRYEERVWIEIIYGHRNMCAFDGCINIGYRLHSLKQFPGNTRSGVDRDSIVTRVIAASNQDKRP